MRVGRWGGQMAFGRVDMISASLFLIVEVANVTTVANKPLNNGHA